MFIINKGMSANQKSFGFSAPIPPKIKKIKNSM
jgi:hypothetical protein